MSKKVIILSGLLFTTLVGIVSLLFIESCLQNCQGPRLEFEEYVKDLGKMSESVSHEVFFKYRNTGNQDLIIYGVVTQCSCQDVSLTNKKVTPGTSGTLRVVVKPVSKGGLITEGIVVKSNDRKQPTQYIQMSRFIVLDTEITPKMLKIRCYSDQTCASGELTVIGPTDDDEFRIVKVESTKESLAIVFQCLGMSANNRSRWNVRCTVDAERCKQNNQFENAELRVITSDKIKPTFVVPLTIVRELPVRVQPKSLSFVLGGSQSCKKKEICVTYFGEIAKVDIEPHLDAPSDIRVRLVSEKSDEDGKHWIYEVEVCETSASSSSINNGIIEFRFSPFAVPVCIPFSILRPNRFEG